MAVDRNISKATSRLKITSAAYTPAATTAANVQWLDSRDAGEIVYQLMHAVGTETISSASIVVNTKSDGTGTNATIRTINVTSPRQPDAVGDYITEEIQVSDIMQKAKEDGVDYRYIALNMAVSATGGKWALTTIMADVRNKYAGLTSDYIS